jgi:hypothetical protein
VFINITLSLIFSFGFLSLTLAWFGPRGTTGSWRALLGRLGVKRYAIIDQPAVEKTNPVQGAGSKSSSKSNESQEQ